MLSVTKYTRYVQPLLLSDELRDRLFVFIAAKRAGDVFNAAEVASVLPLTGSDAFRALKMLADNNVITYSSFECPSCGHLETEVHVAPVSCPDCRHVVDAVHEIFFGLEALHPRLSVKEARDIALERSAKSVIGKWKSTGVVFYLIVDLIGSELIQKKDDLAYTNFLRIMRDIWKYQILTSCRLPFFFLGEVGDLNKIVFSDIRDALASIVEFSSLLRRDTRLRSFVSSNGLPLDFPRYKAILGVVTKPLMRDGTPANPEDVFQKTMDGPYDINSKGVTSLYRIEGQLKGTKERYYSEKFDVALWIPSETVGFLPEKALPIGDSPFHFGEYDDGHLVLFSEKAARYFACTD